MDGGTLTKVQVKWYGWFRRIPDGSDHRREYAFFGGQTRQALDIFGKGQKQTDGRGRQGV